MRFKKLGFATFEGGPTFWRSLLSRFTSGHKKLTLISGGGGRYLRYYRNFTVYKKGLFTEEILRPLGIEKLMKLINVLNMIIGVIFP